MGLSWRRGPTETRSDSTKPESIRPKAPQGANKICVWNTYGPLSNPGRKFKVPWAGQRVEGETQLGIRRVSCHHLGTNPFGLTQEMWSSGVHFAPDLGSHQASPHRGRRAQPSLPALHSDLGVSGRAVAFRLGSRAIAHLRGYPTARIHAQAQVSGSPLGGTRD